jgi:septal ring factor EnvC (AmiA/AmiB activator)
MSRPIYSMTDAELQAENNSLRCENDRLSRALADIAEENAELRAKYDGLVTGIKALKNKIREEEKRYARGRENGGTGAGRV